MTSSWIPKKMIWIPIESPENVFFIPYFFTDISCCLRTKDDSTEEYIRQEKCVAGSLSVNQLTGGEMRKKQDGRHSGSLFLTLQVTPTKY